MNYSEVFYNKLYERKWMIGVKPALFASCIGTSGLNDYRNKLVKFFRGKIIFNSLQLCYFMVE